MEGCEGVWSVGGEGYMELVCEGVGVWSGEDECDFVMIHEQSYTYIVHYSRYKKENQIEEAKK